MPGVGPLPVSAEIPVTGATVPIPAVSIGLRFGGRVPASASGGIPSHGIYHY